MVKLILNLKFINESKKIHEQMNKQWSSSTSNNFFFDILILKQPSQQIVKSN
jgi:hypothetical protein